MVSMTPKEKAGVLIGEMKSVIENSGLYATFDYDCYRQAAIKAAIVLCEQVINVLTNDINPIVNFWFDVKNELEKETA